MPLSADISTALHLLEHVQNRVEDCDDPKLQMHTTQDLKSLISLLEDPVFRSIVAIQDSLIELNTQLGQHPSILPGDFDINISGQLELSVPNTPVQPLGPNIYQDLYQDSSELEDQRVPVAPLVHSSSEDTSAQVTSPSLVSEVMGMPPITTPTYAKEFKKVIEAAAKGRQICTVQLYKPEGTSLGFSVVGLRSKDRGELGIFLQEIQPNGIAGCDGRLVEGDQILAIDGQPLDSNISHEQAISILQKARGLVELVVARSTQDIGSSLPTDELSSAVTPAAGGAAVSGTNQPGSDKEQSVSGSSAVNQGPTSRTSQPSTASAATPTPTPTPTPTSTPVPGGLVVERSPSAVSDASKSGSDMVLNTEWAQVEVINLINDGSGLGFGIIGGRSTGVVVKTILPGGVADRDNRLQSGDHILQIGDVNLRGMGSEQVAAVLRQSGTHVRLVVARPVEPTSPDYQALGSHAPIVPTKILGDPDELDRHLVHSVPETYNIRHVQGDSSYDNGYMYSQESDMELHARPSLIMDVVRNPMPIGTMPVIPPAQTQIPDLPVLTMDATIDVNSLPEMERFTVELKKDIYGLGITIAGYVCEKEELSGIFVKSISEGSAADLSNKIQINDRIVEVDGHSLQGYSNHEAVEVLRSTGQTVVLCLERYLRGPKYEQLQQAIAASELRLPQPSSPSITSLPSFPISADGETTTEIEPEGESHTTVDSTVLQEAEREKPTDDLEDIANVEALLSDPSSELTPQIRGAIKSKWQKILGPDTEIVIAQLKKFGEGSGLGISLEGTVDVENGQEVRPHHYIRSILPEGPVGRNGTLRSGDELLEVNGYRLLGINHMEVVSVLKELPIHVRMVCGRNVASQDPLCPIDTAQHQAAFQTRSILGGSLQNLLPTNDRLVKAKSDGSLASTTTTATVTDASLNKMKSRSLEPLTGLAMWSSEPQIIELVKGERGLGFSILDYQDPMNPNETVIVIRSLVPGGVAQVDGQLIPGDRLLFVNDIALENATLDQAVQALKGAPKGTVRIGVAKPLPIPDSIVQQGVTPICIIKRSQSLPNDSETTDRAADLEDLLSSRSGVTDLSTDKQEDEEEEEEWKDASPVTPVCSPTKKYLGGLPSVLEVDDVSSVSDNAPPKVANPLDKLDVSGAGDRIEKSVEPVAPKVKLKPDPPEETSKVHTEGKDEGNALSIEGRERKASLKRHSSLDSDGRTVPEGSQDKSEGSSEKGARRKVPKEMDDGARRKSRKRTEQQALRLDSTDSMDETGRQGEGTDSQDLETKLRAHRKSLKEQECIERVTEFLRRHSLDLGRSAAMTVAGEPEIATPQRSDEEDQLAGLPGFTSQEDEEAVICVCSRPRPREIEGKFVRERESPRSNDGEMEGLSSDLEEEKLSASLRGTPLTPLSVKEFPAARKSVVSRQSSGDSLIDEGRKGIPREKKRPSSLKKKNLPSRESSRESLLDETRKEVRIQDDVQEIFFEDASESLAALLPEVQLVKARIITAEEAAASIHEESKIEVCSSLEVRSPPEVAIILTDAEKPKAPTRVPSAEVIDTLQLQLPTLAKSTSENTLAGNAETDESKVSQRNLKPEILLDLSKMSASTEEVATPADATMDGKERRPLSRTGSEGSKRSGRDQRSFKIEKLALPAEPELTTLDENRAHAERPDAATVQYDAAQKQVVHSKDTIHGVDVDTVSQESRKRAATLRKVRPIDESPDSPARVTFEDPRLKNEGIPSLVEEFADDRARTETNEEPLAGKSEQVLRREEDSLIGKEHSLEYQSQTLETQSDRFALSSSSLDNLLQLASKSDGWTPTDVSPAGSFARLENVGLKDIFLPLVAVAKERREAETQTLQESKSTQCSPELSTVSQPEDPTKKSPLCNYERFYQSPRKEVQTQTQGENKSVQCSLEEFEEEKDVVLVDASSESPARSFAQESKSVQCLPGDISSRKKARSRRKEAEVQTYQESKGIQCSDEELLDAAEGPEESVQPRSVSFKAIGSDGSESPAGSPRNVAKVVFVRKSADMTVTHRDRDGNVSWNKHWGPERLVKIYREPKTSLGLSIVGGKVDLHNGGTSKSQNISGIFIKNVLPNTPAGKTGELKVGDRIIEVDGVDLRQSTHERAVEVIQAAGNPVCLLVQSLVNLQSPEDDGQVQEDRGSRRTGTPTASSRQKSTHSPNRSPDVIQRGGEETQSTSRSEFRRQSTKVSDGAGPSARRSSMKKSMRKKAPSPPSNPGVLRELSEEREENASRPKPPERKYSSEESSEEEDTRMLEGNVYTKAGMEISRKSAGNVKRSREEIEADPEQEDEFGYTTKKVHKKYHGLGHTVLLVKVDKDRRGLGISLAGHKDRNRMAVFICGLNPNGNAYKAGTLCVGDEILEVNGIVLQGRCHLNASAIIKGMAGTCFKIVVFRKSSGVNDLAVKPIVQFPPTIDEADQFSHYKGVRNVPVKKGQYGLGIMIIEGKHAEVGQGIFVSDIQEGSAAEQAGLQVGDMILAVNMDCLLGSTYDEATSLLKKAEGVVTLIVCNPNQSKIGKEDEEKAKGGGAADNKAAAKEPEKPKEPEPPQDPKDCKINVGRDTTIEFTKDKDKAIGFTIAGGSDTPVNGVFILEVFPDGAAGKDGRLQAGDQILDMCQESFKAIEHDKAHAAVLKASGTITMVVHRHENPCEEIEVELQKKSGKGAGLCLIGFKSGKGAYVSDLLPGGSALESGKICKGDRVVSICGQDVREAPVEDIAFHVKVSNPVQLKLARYKAAKQ